MASKESFEVSTEVLIIKSAKINGQWTKQILMIRTKKNKNFSFGHCFADVFSVLIFLELKRIEKNQNEKYKGWAIIDDIFQIVICFVWLFLVLCYCGSLPVHSWMWELMYVSLPRNIQEKIHNRNWKKKVRKHTHTHTHTDTQSVTISYLKYDQKWFQSN